MRYPDWQIRLMHYVAGRARTPVDPNEPVCALFAAGGVEAMTGQDFAAEWAGRYSTTRGALRVLRKAGYADHVALVAERFEEIAVPFAAPGDLAVIATDDVPAIGIVQGEMIYVQAVNGVGAQPLLSAIRAFRVV